MTPVSAQPYYYYALKEIYSDFGLGPEKARLISPIKWLTDRKIPLALHSDFTMAPAKPLFLMWTAVNKVARQYSIDFYMTCKYIELSVGSRILSHTVMFDIARAYWIFVVLAVKR